MGFANLQGPRTIVDPAGEHPLDIAGVGGLFGLQAASVPTGTPTALLAAPPAGFMWRLHTMTTFSLTNNAEATLICNGVNIGACAGGVTPAFHLAGQLVSNAVTCFQNGTGACSFSLTYDMVIGQKIS